MCGIAGFFEISERRPPDRQLLDRMVSILQYRGPDEFGAYLDSRCALGHARLSIIDLSTGQQPLCNEDGTLWIVFNGEIFNYVELRPELEKLGHRFRTTSDTEVIVHAYEQWGEQCLERFNGQFALALYNSKDESIFLARDRVGVRPLFYTIQQNRLTFASEIKSLFCNPAIPRRIDLAGLDEIFAWWCTSPGRTVFEGISQLEPGTWMKVSDGRISTGRFWSPEFPISFERERSLDSWAEELHALLVDAVRIRLRADVPVGAYLSGGLDSSAITALIRNFTANRVETFSIAFQDKAYDESEYQLEMARFLGTSHRQVHCGYTDIAEVFPEVIWHTEQPVVRTAPAPMFLLSRLVRSHDFKVVLTGEGADELFGGYDIFKETLIRHFWARNPDSAWRPLLLRKLYPTLPLSAARARYYLEEFYKAGLLERGRFEYSHMQRIATTSRIKDFFTPEIKAAIAGHDALAAFGNSLPSEFGHWHHLNRAQYLEIRSLLSGYLLSSQGDRVCAGNAVEGRYPFLDYRVMQFAASVPPRYKIRGLKEKYLLKYAMRKELPASITGRVKQPYMAPDSNSFTQPDAPAWINDTLAETNIKQAGLFQPVMVAKLRDKCTRLAHAHLSFKDNMSFIGILSTQLLHRHFIEEFSVPDGPPLEYRTWHDHTGR